MKRPTLLLIAVSLASLALAEVARADFSSCIASIRADAARRGISNATLDAAFAGLEPDMKIFDLQNAQPEFKTPIWDYIASLVDDERIADGKARLREYARAFETAEQRYGVTRFVIAAVWGVETDYGRSMGKRPLVQSLSTLACFGERMNYFRGELIATLKILNNGDIPADRLVGSWAGAFGQTQFMPSTFLRLAVDLDGDGKRDIVDSPRRAWLHGQLLAPLRLAIRHDVGLRGQAAAQLFRSFRPQAEGADVGLGGAGADTG